MKTRKEITKSGLYWYVGSVYTNKQGSTVNFYAYRERVYGLYKDSDFESPDVLYFDTIEEAKRFQPNVADEFVSCRRIEIDNE